MKIYLHKTAYHKHKEEGKTKKITSPLFVYALISITSLWRFSLLQTNEDFLLKHSMDSSEYELKDRTQLYRECLMTYYGACDNSTE